MLGEKGLELFISAGTPAKKDLQQQKVLHHVPQHNNL